MEEYAWYVNTNKCSSFVWLGSIESSKLYLLKVSSVTRKILIK